MVFINIMVFLLYGMLAVISRKHYSKYKHENDSKGYIRGLFFAMGFTVISALRGLININETSRRIRRLNVVSDQTLRTMTYKYAVRNAGVCLAVVLGFNILSLCTYVVNRHMPEQGNIIERADYSGDAREQEIYMSIDGEKSVYKLQVSPVVYTEEEFTENVSRINEEILREMPADNENLQNIRTDIVMKGTDSTGIFEINWRSDYPEYVTSFGRVKRECLESDLRVTLTAEVSYYRYTDTLTYEVILKAGGDGENNSYMDSAGEALQRLEEESRESASFALPEEVSGVRISTHAERKNKAVMIAALALPACFAAVMVMRGRMSEEIKRRDNMLRVLYPSFVNRLCLLLGAGLTLKNSIKYVAENFGDRTLLTEEISYTLREIASGADEAVAYERLGDRLGLPQYVRTMNHISQNLRLGTRDLRVLMEEESHAAVNDRIEHAKKKGEEASTKLLFPMVILLAVVMVIIIVPAAVNF